MRRREKPLPSRDPPRRVSVLDGGWKKWTAEGRPTTSEVPEPATAAFTPRVRPGWRVTAEEVLAASESGAVILASRDRGQYTGAISRDGCRVGRVPGALHLRGGVFVDPDRGTLLRRGDLGETLREAGVPEDKKASVVAYCNGGVAGTFPLFVLHRPGYENLAKNDGSWKRGSCLSKDRPGRRARGRNKAGSGLRRLRAWVALEER